MLLCVAFGQMAQQQFPSDYRVAQAQEPLKEGLEEETLLTDTSLDLKFETSVNLLINRDNLDEKILRATIRHALDAIFTSNLVIMPTGDINVKYSMNISTISNDYCRTLLEWSQRLICSTSP
jgi:hypothetical protein